MHVTAKLTIFLSLFLQEKHFFFNLPFSFVIHCLGDRMGWITIYNETSSHRFRWGSEKETMDPGKQ
jgi:hypothetical protein